MTARDKILIVRVGRVGDLVMITPAVDSLLQVFPEAEFHLLTAPEGARVLKDFDPRLTRTWLYTRRFPGSWWLQIQLRRKLRAEGYSRIYVFEARPLYRRWLKSLAPRFFGIASTLADTHYCRRCLDVVAGSVESEIPQGWVRLPVSESGRRKARRLLADHGIDPTLRLVGLHPTFSGSTLPFFRDRRQVRHRHWPRDAFAELAVNLSEQAAAAGKPVAIVIDTLPGEREFADSIAEASGGVITLLEAPPDFERYKGFLECLDVLVSSNTGPMHLAAAVGTPIAALFSGWSINDCGPYIPADRYEVLFAEETPHPELGLAAITPHQVGETVMRLLEISP